MKSLPLILVLFRAAAAPLLLMDGWDGSISNWFLPLYFLAFVSDIFDGIVARRYGVSTADLRVADSLSDTLLYSCLAIAAWRTHGDLLIANRMPLVSVTLGIGLWMAVNWLKYGKLASYHTYSAKLWGLSLCQSAASRLRFWRHQYHRGNCHNPNFTHLAPRCSQFSPRLATPPTKLRIDPHCIRKFFWIEIVFTD
jgi:hypothetical protein